MSKRRDKGDLFTELEEALRGIHGVTAVLEKLVEVSSDDDAPIYDLLASHLGLSYRQAHRAFCALHDLVVQRPRRPDHQRTEGEA